MWTVLEAGALTWQRVRMLRRRAVPTGRLHGGRFVTGKWPRRRRCRGAQYRDLLGQWNMGTDSPELAPFNGCGAACGERALFRNMSRGRSSPPLFVCLVQPPSGPSNGFDFSVLTAQQVASVQHEPQVAGCIGALVGSPVE